jgi:beta-glucanase (GH16 family)
MAIPYRRGLWPAFWTFTSGAGQNACEIDIFEMYGCKGSNHIETNIHRVYDYAAPYDTATMYLQEDDLNNFSYTDWHIYAIEWDPNKIIWYVDNTPIRLMYNHGITGNVKLILNVAAQETKKCALPTGLPINDSMFVDYIRTYRLKCDNQTVVTEIPDFSLYEYSVKKSITLGSGTTIPLSSDISLRATDFIELLPDFEVPAGCELYLDVSPCSNTVP